MFTIKAYSRKELSLLYFPDSSPIAAYTSLRRWLNEHKDTSPELLLQIKGRRVLRKDHVAKIVELIGEP